jgi:hypothetical protein
MKAPFVDQPNSERTLMTPGTEPDAPERLARTNPPARAAAWKERLRRAGDAAAGAIIGSLLGAAAGAVAAYPVLAFIQWQTRHTWEEFWGEIGAVLYGAPIGAALGAILGALLPSREPRRESGATGPSWRRFRAGSRAGGNTGLPDEADYFRPTHARELRARAAWWVRVGKAVRWISLVTLVVAAFNGIGVLGLLGSEAWEILGALLNCSCLAFFGLGVGGALFVMGCSFEDRAAALRQAADALEAEHAARYGSPTGEALESPPERGGARPVARVAEPSLLLASAPETLQQASEGSARRALVPAQLHR